MTTSRKLKAGGLMFAAVLALAGCDPESKAERTAALPQDAWAASAWISVKDAPVAVGKDERAADGTSRFFREIANAKAVRSVKWMTTALGVYELSVNGRPVGGDALKPGFTHVRKTRRSFTYDVTALARTGAGEANVFAADVSAGWWRDKIVDFAGKKSAFRAVLEYTYADGTTELVGTDAKSWSGVVGGPVVHAAIFDGEEYDARVPEAVPEPGRAPYGCEANGEFAGEILPSEGGEVCRRWDLALKPVGAYVWKGVEGADPAKQVFGRVKRLRDAAFDGKTPVVLAPGETLVVDFGQNCAAVPCFRFSAAEGTVLTCLPAEMLNDANGERSRGNDGPAGSVYRENLRCPDRGMRVKYTFGPRGPQEAAYLPRFTFFGYRYVSITATDAVSLYAVASVPVTSIARELELGKVETGVPDVNRLISNVYWGQLSNYLSVSTDCPQRNERLGWTADTQVFAEAGSFNADTSGFFRKWMRDMRDSQHELGGFPGVAPFAQYGNEPMRLGWADAGVIVPYQIWKQFGDTAIVDENWAAMEKYVARVNETKFGFEATRGENGGYQWADWLSYEDLESCSGRGWETKDGRRTLRDETRRYWDYLGACYWMWDAEMMRQMAAATGADAAKYAAMRDAAKAHLKKEFFSAADGMILPEFRGMQTLALFALKFGLVEGAAKAATVAALRKNIADHGDCLQTGFLGTSILMDTLTENGCADVAYTLLLQHKNPSWLYSVDQGATTIWERWNSYRRDTGFGPVGMNSFNHYAYGAVLAWIYKTAAGIAADPDDPGFRTVVMAPVPDRRLGYVKAEYRSAAGLVRSAWRYEGDKWIWSFTVPEGAKAKVRLPGETAFAEYKPGSYEIVR